MGAYPDKALAVLRGVSTRMETWVQEAKFGSIVLPQVRAGDMWQWERGKGRGGHTPLALPPFYKGEICCTSERRWC